MSGSLITLDEADRFGIILQDVALTLFQDLSHQHPPQSINIAIFCDGSNDALGGGDASLKQDGTGYFCQYITCSPAALKLKIEAHIPEDYGFPSKIHDNVTLRPSRACPPVEKGRYSKSPHDPPKRAAVAPRTILEPGEEKDKHIEPLTRTATFILQDLFETICDVKDIALDMKGPSNSTAPPLHLSAKCIIFPILLLNEEFFDPLAPDEITGTPEEVDPVSLSDISDPVKKLFGGIVGTGTRHYERWKQLRQLGDLEASIRRFQEASVFDLVQADHPGKQHIICNLAVTLAERFSHGGQSTYLDTAITSLESIIDQLLEHTESEGHDFRRGDAALFDTLAACHYARFRLTCNIDDIDRSVKASKLAQSLTSREDNRLAFIHDHYAIIQMARFNHSGDVNWKDLDSSISSLRFAVDDTLTRGASRLSLRRSNLGYGLAKRFEYLGDSPDIEEAISLLNIALAGVNPHGRVERPRILTRLGAAHALRFRSFRTIEDGDSDAAIQCHKEALGLISETDPVKARCLHNLGNALRDRFEYLGTADPSDIHTAIAILEEASQLVAGRDAGLIPVYLQDLAEAFKIRFQSEYHKLSDIDNAISTLQTAINHISQINHLKVGYWLELADAFLLRTNGLVDSDDAIDAVLLLRTAAGNSKGTAKCRFHAYEKLAYLSREHSPREAPADFRQAIDLLHCVAWLGLTVDGRHHALVDAGHIVCDAAAHAFSLGEVDIAIYMLENGRAVVWGQLGHHLLQLDDLRVKNPDLADMVQTAVDELTGRVPYRGSKSIEPSWARHNYEEDWGRLIDEVRKHRGFEQFFKPLTMDHFREWQIGREGAIVIVNVSKIRCDACIIAHPSLEQRAHLPLLEFTYEKAVSLQEAMRTAAQRGFRDDFGEDYVQPELMQAVPKLDFILEQLWLGIAKPVLERLGIALVLVSRDEHHLPRHHALTHLIFLPYMSEPTRIWWCPTGPLTSLPLHAAGTYRSGSLNPTLSDFAISSYTPTATTLVRSEVKKAYRDLKILAVASPSSRGLPPIKGTEEELGYIQEICERHKIPVKRLMGPEALEKDVLENMDSCDWVHFACHGMQSASPDKSALYLADGDLNLMEIIVKDLPHAKFAFLSACQTAKGDTMLSEETFHISAGMLQAGYRAVIVTMWSIPDAQTPRLVKEFYERLLNKPNPVVGDTARYLWEAIREVQDSMPLHHWVPFIHLGGP